MPALVENPMNTAHIHAENAESFRSKGLLIPALDEHLKAAEGYLSAFEQSNDDLAKRTLKMLHLDHMKAHQQLQKKVEKLRQEGKDPALPQPKPDLPMPGSYNPNAPPAHPISTTSSYRSDLQNTVDESFMLLGGAQKSDPGDAFNDFWNIMQGMLDNLSQPVAFATAPLTTEPSSSSYRPSTPPTGKLLRRDSSLSSETDSDETLTSRLSRRLGLSSVPDPKSKPAKIDYPPPPPQREEEFDEELFDEDGDDDLSGSFFLIPSNSDSAVHNLRKENALLKAEVTALKKRVDSILQLRKEQEDKLRDSIFLATKEAQRAIGAPPRGGIDFGNLATIPQVPIPGYNTAREAQYARKVKELQDELGTVRAELDKTRADNLKHREKWAKLKETHRRKKETKAAEAAKLAGVREQPEVEEAEDRAQKS